MKAGRELDALVAERAMGLPIASIPSTTHETYYYITNRSGDNSVPRYSVDIAAAWEVVDALSHRNFSLIAHNDAGQSGSSKTEGSGWCALFHIEGGPMAYTSACTAPLAISLAALKAVGHKFE